MIRLGQQPASIDLGTFLSDFISTELHITAILESYIMILASVLGYLQQYLAKIARLLVVIAMLLLLASCSGAPQADQTSLTTDEASNKSLFAPRPKVKQLAPPALIQKLTPWLDSYAPQVQIRQPKAEQVFDSTTVSVVLQAQDLPIYKDETWGMGPHLEMLLDNQPYGSIYDIDQPIRLEKLSPGTHTLRVLAELPWHESFKNEGSYDQVTFHIFAKTDENSPTVSQPLLTYSSPVGAYGAEPVLLDFYLTGAPLHQVAQDNPMISDWRVRYTINGDSFTLNNWEPIYIEGLQPGQNWVQLTLIDDEENPIEGVFNNTVRLIEYDPDLNDSLAKIVRGELTLADVGGIVDPSYEPPVPEVIAPVEPLPMEDAAVDDGDKLTNDELENDSAMPEPEVSEPEVSEPESIESKLTEPEATESSPQESSDIPSKQPLEEDELKTTSLDEQLSEPVQETEQAQESGALQESVQEMDISDVLEENASSNTEAAADLEDGPISDTSAEETAAESTNISDDAEETAAESTNISDDVDSVDSAASEVPSAEASPVRERQYLQRLYDYRERSMQTYGRDR
ncbi:MAG: hypothetical protein AAF572_10700 [Cyanobacteria bacterium P01_B01_bin.77]